MHVKLKTLIEKVYNLRVWFRLTGLASSEKKQYEKVYFNKINFVQTTPRSVTIERIASGKLGATKIDEIFQTAVLVASGF